MRVQEREGAMVKDKLDDHRAPLVINHPLELSVIEYVEIMIV